MAASRRDEIWRVFARVRDQLKLLEMETEAGVMHRLSREMTSSPYTHVLVDEAQDVSVAELHLLRALTGERPNGLFFAGDIGQRIFRSAFPWKSAGIDMQGRSRSLKVNYRTSHQIRAKSDILLPPRILETDGGEDRRLGVSSVFHGPAPKIEVFATEAGEIEALGNWLKECEADGVRPETTVILVRSDAQIPRAKAARLFSGLAQISIMLMHDAKGREFHAVAVMACDADVLPDEQRLISAGDDRALREVYDTERHLLYVAATRAREQLWLSAAEPPSEFLDDLIT
jgi:superfamily I DNA/RNA helicase